MDEQGLPNNPPSPEQNPSTGDLETRDIVTFGGTLLTALGIGSLLNWMQARKDRKASQAEAQRRAEYDAEIERKRAIGHEPSDIRIRPVIAVGVVSAIFLGLLSVVLLVLFGYFTTRPLPASEPRTALDQPRALPPEPRLQASPVQDWQILRATEEALLNGYSVDRSSGTIKIPIDRAIDLLSERGLPVQNGADRQFGDRQPSSSDAGGWLHLTPGPRPQQTGTPQSENVEQAP